MDSDDVLQKVQFRTTMARLPENPTDEDMVRNGWVKKDGRWAKHRNSRGWRYYESRKGKRLVGEGTRESRKGKMLVGEGTRESRKGTSARQRLDAIGALWAANSDLATVYSSLNHAAAEGRSLFHGTTTQAWESIQEVGKLSHGSSKNH